MAADFFEKDFNFEKYISERLLEIDDEKTRVEMRELMQHTMIPFYRHTEEAYRGFVERYRISAEVSMGSCDVITGLMKRGKIDVTDHSFVPMIPEDAHKEVLSAQQMIEALEQGQSYKIMSIFIRLGYDRLRQIEQEQRYFRGTIYTDYSEYPMKVVIKKNERYPEKIRDLYRIFEENHVRWKSICAPYIEKIYDVYVVETECPDDDEILRIDVDFEELSDVILYDYIPMWNIYTGNERTGIYPELSVDRVNYDHLIYASRFQKGKDYLIDSRETKVWNVYRTDADMRIICDSAEPISWDVLEFSYEPYEREMDMPVFGNRDSSEIRDAEIHTMAEVKRFIHALGYDNLLRLKDIKVMKIKRQDIYKTTYSMDAFMEDELRNGFTRQVLRLVFQRVAEPGYLDWDIMSYIISRIQWKLPEFNCIGEFE